MTKVVVKSLTKEEKEHEVKLRNALVKAGFAYAVTLYSLYYLEDGKIANYHPIEINEDNFAGMGYMSLPKETRTNEQPKPVIIRKMLNEHLLNAIRYFRKRLKLARHLVVMGALNDSKRSVKIAEFRIAKYRVLLVLLCEELKLRGLAEKPDSQITPGEIKTLMNDPYKSYA